MKQRSLLLFTLLYALSGYSQRNDNTWIFGYHYSPIAMVPGLDFYYGFADTVGFNPPFDFISGADGSICDDGGNLQLYSNGNEVANWNNLIIQNSTGFNVDGTSYSNDFWQGVIVLPYPGHAGEYVLFHLCAVYTANWLYPLKLFYSVVDMNLNGGLGSMTLKNQIAFTDTLLPCAMQATKHGNGRDWWIINKKANSNAFHLALLTPAGISQDTVISTGPFVSVFNYSEGQSTFSPDGSLYAMTFNTDSSLYLYDFDRCSGLISFRDSVRIVPIIPNHSPVWGCSFSPGSRYLYATTTDDLYQFDMQATSLAASQIHVASFDGFTDPFPNYFFRHALGPDGKIYMTSWGGTRFLHVINDPDQPGALCNFGQHQLQLISYHVSTLPEFPNYRLGPLTDSPCDSIPLGTESASLHESALLDVFPNPNDGEFTVAYQVKGSHPEKLIIQDLFGQVVYEKKLPAWSTLQNLHLRELPAGIYSVKLEDEPRVVTQKFIKN